MWRSWLKLWCTPRETGHQDHLWLGHNNKSLMSRTSVCAANITNKAQTHHPAHIRSSHLNVRLCLCRVPQWTACTMEEDLYLALNFNDLWVAWTQHSSQDRLTHTQTRYRYQHGFRKRLHCHGDIIDFPPFFFFLNQYLQGKEGFFFFSGMGQLELCFPWPNPLLMLCVQCVPMCMYAYICVCKTAML